MTKEEYILLYEKYISGKCTEQEKRLFETYTDEFSLADQIWDAQKMGSEQVLKDKMYSRLYHEMEKKPKSIFQFWRRLSVAAAVFLIAGAGIFFFLNMPSAKLDPGKVELTVIRPGSKRAILTLHDGSKIILDETRAGIVASQGAAVISKNKEGQIIYQTTGEVQSSTGNEIFNSISTPRGGESQLLLPDGTKVWLNAESSIRFPAVFTGTERKVEITGEAYLEVFENKKKPFIVEARGTEVEVLGTHFNINAYDDQPQVNTTLLEGSVRLSKNGKEVMLKPGQSGLSINNGGFKVHNVNVEDAIAWKNGYFVFQGEDISSIMAQAARWYDVEVVYQGSMKDKNFDARMTRYENITELLKNMELTGEVHFKIQGRRVTVMSK